MAARCRPHPGLAEQIVAKHLAHIIDIFLEPFEVELAYTLDGVLLVLVILAEVDAHVEMVPVGPASHMHFCCATFRPTA